MSKIQWTDKTSNPIKRQGGGNFCKLISPGCVNCYASLLNSRGTRFGGNGMAYGGSNQASPEMTLNTDMLAKWARMRKPKKHFIGSMTDIFGEWVPEMHIQQMLDAMLDAPKQTFQLLTKRPDGAFGSIAHFCDWNGLNLLPPNIWLGISAEDQQRLDERLIWLMKTQAQVRFLSLEPLLGPIRLPVCHHYEPADAIPNWIIIGGESGPKARPLELAWIIDILEQCKEAGIPAFVKQLGTRWAERAGANDRKGGNPDEWPIPLRVRMFPGEAWPKRKPNALWDFWG